MSRTAFPVLVSIPHGGVLIPSEIRDLICLEKRDIFEDGDAFTRELYDFGSLVKATVYTPVARAAVDLNRAPDDLPPGNPDGVLKTVTAMGKRVYKKHMFPRPHLVSKLLHKYYFPYHNKLEVLSGSEEFKLALDCHSMAAFGPPTAKDSGKKRPLFCLSNRGDERGLPRYGENITCSPEILNRFAMALRLGFGSEEIDIDEKMQINNPFLGEYIIQKHSRKGMPWIQVEINRSLYLNCHCFNEEERNLAFERIEKMRNSLIKSLQIFFDRFC